MSHSMQRRSPGNNYRNPGLYHITINVHDRRCQSLSRIIGDVQYPDGHPNAPAVELTAIGKMVEYELLHSITQHYPVIEIQDYVVMPEHMHFIIHVKNSLISKNGRQTHLGQVIAGFKEGCNRRYWQIIGQQVVAAKQQPTTSAPAPAASAPATSAPGPAAASPGPTAAASAVAGGFDGPTPGPAAASPGPTAAASAVAGGFATSAPVPGANSKLRFSSDRRPLFAAGYVDVIPLKPGQLETQRAYIHANPRNRLLRTNNPSTLKPQRHSIDTLVTPKALHGYLIREHAISAYDAQTWQAIAEKLLTSDYHINNHNNDHHINHSSDRHIVCDSYGDRELSERPLLPVVCHRKDQSLFVQQKQACLTAAANGTVLVSARIAKGEQAIIDEAIAQGHPVILITDNGFPEIYHPSEKRLQLCTAHRLLLLTPWTYQYRPTHEDITVAQCKTMNCLAQAICRTKDDWWKKGDTP